jgi:hypothetical protein
MSKKELEKLLNPIGFLEERERKNYEGLEGLDNQRKYDFVELKDSPQEKVECAKNGAELLEKVVDQPKKYPTELSKEYGFKIKGPEPTRYGDWERKGRCFDF